MYGGILTITNVQGLYCYVSRPDKEIGTYQGTIEMEMSKVQQEWITNGYKYLWVNISDMKDKFIKDTQFKLSDEGKAYLQSKEIKKGTLLMSFKLTLGKTAFAGKDLFTNEAICALIPKDKEDETVSEYLYYILHLRYTIVKRKLKVHN